MANQGGKGIKTGQESKTAALLKLLGWETNSYALFEQALTHTSYAHEKGHRRCHYQRLEFLGDAVLELIISDYLYFTYPHLPEGKLTKLRADLVCAASLSRLAYEINLGDYLRLGKGEIAAGGASRPGLLADAMEALIGALYLDQGLKYSKPHVLELYRPILGELQEGILRRDYKTLLQEFAQARFGITPAYWIAGESGPDHDKLFEAEVLLDKQVAGRGRGRSKKEAEQDAAREAWGYLTP